MDKQERDVLLLVIPLNFQRTSSGILEVSLYTGIGPVAAGSERLPL